MRGLFWCAGVLVAGTLVWITSLGAFQKPFRQYRGVEYQSFTVPAGADLHSEFVFARLMFPPGPLDGYQGRAFIRDWREGPSLWTQDYPRADRHFLEALARLARLHTRSAEQPVNLDLHEEFENPFLYAVQVGEWGLTEPQGKELSEYLLRGGFFMADDFHGDAERAEFVQRIQYACPDRPIVDIPDGDQILHVVYDLTERVQIPGWAHLRAGYKSENGPSARIAHWQAIYDDKGRVMVAISYNQDIGDGWEWSDDPAYPEKSASTAIRIGMNNIVYAMTH